MLVTGGTGTLGGLVAGHLVAGHGVRDVVLASRRGPGAAGAAALAAGLAGAGAGVRVVACDSADRGALAGLVAGVGRLAGVVHCAGVLRDATVAAMDRAGLGEVLAAKAEAAWHLHELTAGMGLGLFALFSSVAGVLGTAGQGSYAAANAFLDALAAWRRGRGLPAVSLAWGLWEQESGMTGHLGERDLARLRRAGLAPLSSDRALELFDAGAAGADPAVVATGLDPAGLAGLARAGTLPAMLHDLVRVPVKALPGPDDGGTSLAGRLSGLDDDERRRVLMEIVCGRAASVLGWSGSDGIPPDQAFRDLGFDSLTAVELRNQLTATTGLRLPTTLVFDYPTPAVLAAHLLKELGQDKAPAQDDDEAKIRRVLATVPFSRLRATGVMDVLLDLADSSRSGPLPAESSETDSIDDMDEESLIDMVLAEADSDDLGNANG